MALYHTSKGFGVDWRDEFGRRRRRFVGTEEAARRMDAELRANGAQARATLANYRTSAAIDLSTAIDLYLAHLSGSPVTKLYQSERLHHAATRMANPRITDVTPKLLEEYSTARRQELAPSSLIKEHQLLKTLFRFLTERWYLPASPAEALETTGLPRSSGRAITHAEEWRILISCTERIRTKFLCALDAGLRQGECNRLRQNHLNFDLGMVDVWSTKTRTDRRIPLTPRLQVALETLSAGLAPDALLFARAGRKVKKGHDALKLIRPKARVQFRFHDLRHTFASRLASAVARIGLDARITAHLLGHAPKHTTDLYVHFTPEQLHDAISAMAEDNLAALRAAQPPKEET